MRALKKYGVEPIIIEYPFPLSSRDPYSYGKNLIKYFLDCPQKPDAVQAYSDLIGLGFLAGLHEKGINVPEDVALVGFDDRMSASMCWPLLTTVAQPNEGVGSTAAEILLRKIKGEPSPEGGWSTSLPTELIIREST
jgi:LacI family transcriptional regulator